MHQTVSTPGGLMRLWLPSASQHGAQVDLLFAGLFVSSVLVCLLLFFLLLRFAIRYREGSNADRDHRIKKSWHWEVSWTAATLVAFLGLFIWGAHLFLQLYITQADALPIYVVAKQWMWKVQHVGGQREIDELHVPVGRNVRLIMASQDVIHSFFIPALRIKHDVVPGRYQELHFRADKPGVYHLFCSEYCGTDHSLMIGRVVVMEPQQFASWLAHQNTDGTLAARGEERLRSLGCSGCHGESATVRAPPLEGLYGKPVPLQNGDVTTADEKYLRDSILLPRSQIVAGYEPVMPSYQDKISEDDLVAVVAYIKSLADVARPPR